MSASGAGTSYRAALALPHARGLFLSAAIGRLSYAVLPLAMFFMVRNAAGSFATAGLVMPPSTSLSSCVDQVGRSWSTGTAVAAP